MTTESTGRHASNRRWAHTALGTAAAAVTGVATVLVGAPMIGVTPPPSDTSPYCPAAYQRLQPGADPLVRNGRDAPVPYRPATCRFGMPSWPTSNSQTGAPPDQMLAPARASNPP